MRQKKCGFVRISHVKTNEHKRDLTSSITVNHIKPKRSN
jgi:hypothetical protein